jgi:hypothetical protein
MPEAVLALISDVGGKVVSVKAVAATSHTESAAGFLLSFVKRYVAQR